MKAKIEAQIARLNSLTLRHDADGNATRKTTERVHRAIGFAQQWLANGGLSRYSNEDFDVLNSLVCVENDLR